MAADIGVRIGIDGEKTFKTALTGINAQLKNLNSEMKAVVSDMAGMSDAEGTAAKRTDVLTRSIEASKQKIQLISGEYDRAKANLDQLGRELDDAKQAFGENSSEAIKAQNAYNRQAAAVNKLGSQLNEATADMNKMEKELRDIRSGADRAADAMDDLADAAEDAGREGKGLSSIKDAIAGGAISGAVQSLVTGMRDLVESTREYRTIMASLEVSSQKAGYTAQQTQASYEQLYAVLGDDQTAATTLANLQALGLSQADLTTIINGTIGAWATYGDSIPIDSLGEAINETIRVGQVTGTFADMLNWAGTSEDEFNAKLAECSTEAERTNLILQEMANQGLVEAAEAWRKNNPELAAANEAQARLNASMAEFATAISPLTATATNLAATAISGISTSMQTLISAFQSGGLEGFFVSLSGILENVKTTAVNVLYGLAANIRANFPQLMSAGLEALVTFTAGLRENVGQLVTAGLEVVSALGSGIIKNIPALIKTVPEIVTNIANIINDNAPKLVSSALELITQLAAGLIQAIPTLIASIPKIIEAVVSTFLAFNWIGLGKNIITFLRDGVVSMAGAVQSAAASLKDKIISIISQLPGKLLALGRSGIQSLVSGILGLLGSAVSAMQSILAGMMSAVLTFPSKMASMGTQIVQGLANGIRNAGGQVATALKGVIDSAVNKAKSLLGIASPSKVFMAFGKYVIEGLVIGIDRNAHQAVQSISRTMRSVESTVLSMVDTLNSRLIAKEEELTQKLKDTGLDEATKKSLQAQLETVKTFRSEYEKSISDLQEKQDSLVDKLRSYGDLFSTVRTDAGEFLQISDLQEDIDAINAYSNALERLKAKGVSDSLMDEILGMNVEDATEYTQQLLSMTEDEYDQYMALWEKKQEAASSVASRFYAEEMTSLVNEFVKKVPGELGIMKDDLYYTGQMAAEGLAAGIWDRKSAVIAAAQSVAQAAREALRASEGIHSPAKKWMPLGDYMAQGVGEGFSRRMKSVAANITSSIPSAAAQIEKVGSGMVNGIQTAMSGNQGGAYTFNLMLPDGTTLARYQLPALIDVARANGTPILNPM